MSHVRVMPGELSSDSVDPPDLTGRANPKRVTPEHGSRPPSLVTEPTGRRQPMQVPQTEQRYGADDKPFASIREADESSPHCCMLPWSLSTNEGVLNERCPIPLSN